jgi:hypothetical protein
VLEAGDNQLSFSLGDDVEMERLHLEFMHE